MIRNLILILALLALVACARPPDDRPNIILVTIDTLRWDYLNTYGFEEPGTTPAATFLAENGLVFDNAVSTAGTTVPSHGSMLTGLYARLHGARSNFHGKYPGVRTLASALQEAGYRTGAFVSNIALLHVGKLDEGFEATNMPVEAETGQKFLYPGEKTVGQARDWLDSMGDQQPFFTWLHLWEPHGPYDPNEWSRQRLGDYSGLLEDGVSINHIRNNVREIVDSPEHVQAMRTLYAGEVQLADQHLGSFLRILEESGQLQNSLVIFTADHGQSLGEKRRMGHGPTHRETVLRVPMIIADFRDDKTGRFQARVSTIDIAPTIAEAAGLDEYFDSAGRSLLQANELEDDWPYFAEVAMRTETDANWQRVKNSTTYDAEALAVYNGPHKMTFRHGKYQLYETGIDLKVARKLKPGKRKSIATQLQGMLESFQEIPLDQSGGDASQENIELLKSLGYTQ